MVVTEIALLRLTPPVTIDDSVFRSALGNAKAVMQNYTGRRFYYLHQIEDQSLVYIIGEWGSLDRHMNHFIPSTENQSLLESLKHMATVDWLLHIDAPHATLPLPNEDGKGHGASKEYLYGITRHFVKSGGRISFEKAFHENKEYLQNHVTEGKIGGGWRVDKENDKEEFVLFSPWQSVDQHYDFADTEGFEKYGKIREYIDGAEIKHAKMLDI